LAFEVCGKTLQPLPEMHTDPTRMMIDAAIQNALWFAALDNIWAMLAVEPIISAKHLY
jgi:hypothetical protein